MSTTLETDCPVLEQQSFASCYRRGVMGSLQVSVFPFIFGTLFVTAALSRGIAVEHAILMSVIVFAGSVLFAAMELWADPLPYFALAVTAASVASRHVLMGLTLPVLFRKNIRHIPFLEMFFLTDLSWLLTTRSHDVSNRYAFYLGVTTVIFSAWVAGSFLGWGLANVVDTVTIQATRSMGVVFISLIILLYSKGFQESRWPWLVAAVAAALVSLYSPKFTVLAGVAAGTVAAFLATGKSHA